MELTAQNGRRRRDEFSQLSEAGESYFQALWSFWQQTDSELASFAKQEDSELLSDALVTNNKEMDIQALLDDQSWLMGEMLRVRSKKTSDVAFKLKVYLENTFPGVVNLDGLSLAERLLHQAVRELETL